MDERKIDVNKASVEVLEKLKGVGRAKAESIVTTREVSSKAFKIIALDITIMYWQNSKSALK